MKIGRTWHQRISALGYASRWGAIWETVKLRPNAGERWTYQIIREGRDLLHTTDSYVLDTLRLTLLKECMVNLTCGGKYMLGICQKPSRRYTYLSKGCDAVFRWEIQGLGNFQASSAGNKCRRPSPRGKTSPSDDEATTWRRAGPAVKPIREKKLDAYGGRTGLR
jgi:hypothetical protein